VCVCVKWSTGQSKLKAASLKLAIANVIVLTVCECLDTCEGYLVLVCHVS